MQVPRFQAQPLHPKTIKLIGWLTEVKVSSQWQFQLQLVDSPKDSWQITTKKYFYEQLEFIHT